MTPDERTDRSLGIQAEGRGGAARCYRTKRPACGMPRLSKTKRWSGDRSREPVGPHTFLGAWKTGGFPAAPREWVYGSPRNVCGSTGCCVFGRPLTPRCHRAAASALQGTSAAAISVRSDLSEGLKVRHLGRADSMRMIANAGNLRRHQAETAVGGQSHIATSVVGGLG